MITDSPQTWPLCIVCNDGTRIAPYFVSRQVMRLVAGSGFGVSSVWACGRHTQEEIGEVRRRIHGADGVPVLQAAFALDFGQEGQEGQEEGEAVA